MTKDLTLEDLANASGLSLRTLRFYISEGLLQGPDTHGKFARYSQQHLDRLEMIHRLKNLRLPIKEIRHLLDNMTPDEISQIRKYQEILNPSLTKNKTGDIYESPISEPGSSALEYIQNLENGRKNIQSITRSPATVPPSPPIYKNQAQAMGGQEIWKRIVIEEGIELNIRGLRDTDEEIKVRKLIEFTRKLFGNHSK
jgi:DNA-binding transcriptional MerR regulator